MAPHRRPLPGASRNPYLDALRSRPGVDAPVIDPLVAQFGFAVPDEAALGLIGTHSPNGVVEIGAGTGYWARLLAEWGVEVSAFDLAPPPSPANKWFAGVEPWFPVAAGDERVVAGFPERTALLVWPTRDEDWGADAALLHAASGGQRFVYVGEPPGGRTGDLRLHAVLGLVDRCVACTYGVTSVPCTCGVSARWRLIGEHPLPGRPGRHDRLYLFDRPPAPLRRRPFRWPGRAHERRSFGTVVTKRSVDSITKRGFDGATSELPGGQFMVEGNGDVVAAVKDAVLTLRLNRPSKLNAITYGVIATLLEQLEQARHDPEVRCVLLCGEGRAFCAGDDVVSMGTPPYQVPPGEHPVRHMQQRLIKNWFWYPKPTVAAVHGRCHGIGGDLAMAADFRIVSDDVVFGDLRSRRAIPVGSGGTWLLPRMIGLSRATALMLTGGTIGADEMDRFGLATEVVPADRFRDRVEEFARTIAAGPTKALSIMKRELRQNLSVGLEEALDLEISLLDEPVEDRLEGVRSFAEGRQPVYTGR